MPSFSDRELSDFLDGTLSDTRSAELVQALTLDNNLETRLMALDSVAPIIREAFADVGRERSEGLAVPAPDALPALARTWKPMLIAASAAAVIAVFSTYTLMNRGPVTADWMQQVASYQALYSMETIDGVSSTKAELETQLSRVEASMNISLPKEALSQIPGLELRRTQMLAYQGQPLAQIVFADGDGRPIALCILMTDDAPAGNSIDVAVLQGLESAVFSNAGFGFLLIGPANASDIAGYADYLKGALAQG